MIGQKYGGNIVKNNPLNESGKKILCSDLYEYFFQKVNKDELLKLEGLESFSLFVLKKETSTSIAVLGNGLNLELGDSLQVEDSTVNLQITGGYADFLVVGSNFENRAKTKSISHQLQKEVYKVNKPWGYELWISGQHPTYAFKEIFIKAGSRTSLQFHDKKKETNLLVSGRAKLHYTASLKTDDIETILGEVSEVDLEPTCLIDVKPGNIHRIQAITDIILYEASTPHLDDVTRLADDNKRPDGRIKEEHPSL